MEKQRNKAADSRRLEKSDWIDIALETLTSESIDAVLVVPLAKKLGVTKGSFYWHFKNREDLLLSALEEWHRRTTRTIIQYVEQKFSAPEDRLRELFRISFESKYQRYEGQVELAIRDWARLDLTAREVVAKVDSERIGYLAEQYEMLGYGAEEAKSRALLQTSFSSGNGIIFGIGDNKKRFEYASKCFDIILGKKVS